MALIIIDLDNTLVDRAADFRRWAELFVSHFGFEKTFVETLISLDNDGVVIREDFTVKVSNALQNELSASEILSHYRMFSDRSPNLEKENVLALQKLKQAGHTLGIVTNGPQRQHDVIKNTGLDKLVDAWVVSDTAGVSKPDPRIAELLAERLGIELQNGYVIGDSIADVELAKNISFESIWINRGRIWNFDNFSPDYELASFAEASHVCLKPTIQELELVDRRWKDLLEGRKLDTIRFDEMHIEPGLMVYRNCSDLENICVVHATKAVYIPLRDVLKYAKDIDYKQNEENLLAQMKTHYPDITLDTVIQYIQHLSPDETKERYPDDVNIIETTFNNFLL